MNIEKHQFIDYLKSRGSSIECSCCNFDEWHMLIHEVDDIKNQKLMPFSINHLCKIGNVTTSAALDVAVLVCSNCGFVRLHSLAKIIGDFKPYDSDNATSG